MDNRSRSAHTAKSFAWLAWRNADTNLKPYFKWKKLPIIFERNHRLVTGLPVVFDELFCQCRGSIFASDRRVPNSSPMKPWLGYLQTIPKHHAGWASGVGKPHLPQINKRPMNGMFGSKRPVNADRNARPEGSEVG